MVAQRLTTGGGALRFRGFTTNSLREALRVLRRAEELLAHPERWTKNAWARDAVDAPVHPIAESAVAWCLGGAVIRANAELFGGRVRVQLDATTKTPIAVHGPRRLAVTLTLLALPAAFAAVGARNRACAANGGAAGAGKTSDVDLSVIAVWANDLQQTTHEHILFALARAIDDVRAELSDRRRAAGR